MSDEFEKSIDALREWINSEHQRQSTHRIVMHATIKGAEEHSRARFAPMVQASQPMKLCIHCRHYSPDAAGNFWHSPERCMRPTGPSVVDGSMCPLFGSPAIERLLGPCGMDAKFWEQKA